MKKKTLFFMVDWPRIDEALPLTCYRHKGALEIAATRRQFLGHQLAGFQGISWQTSGPREPNTISTFIHEACHGEGLGKQPRCP